MARTPVSLLVGTRKGAFIINGDASRRTWKIAGPHQFGHIVYHVVLDPRDGRTLLLAAKTGHLGPTVFRSKDRGRTWKEASKPPAFPKAAEGEKGRVVDHTFWLTPGHESEPGVWYAGTSPHGLFRSEDGGNTWEGVAGFNRNPKFSIWCTGEETPDGAKTHSILIDPRDRNHMYLGLSGGGVFESRDQGRNWAPLNRGVAVDFMPKQEKEYEYGHDPHCVRLHPLRPDRLYQQNHCGIYRLDRDSGDRWVRIGDNMPRKIRDIGFVCVVHPRDPDAVWVFPMDGTEVWPRTSVGGQAAVYATRNGGKTWKRQDKGLPQSQAWFTVKRQAMCADSGAPAGVYFGNTHGQVWASRDEGESWKCVAMHLPHIYSVEVAEFKR